MAEKVEQIMDRGNMVVTHRGDEVTLDTPEWFNVPPETWFDEEKLVSWCRDKGILHATLHKGFEQHVIDLRAKARPADLKPIEKGEKPRPQKIEQDAAQERVSGYKPEPRTPGPDPVKQAADILKGLTEAQKAALKEQGLI